MNDTCKDNNIETLAKRREPWLGVQAEQNNAATWTPRQALVQLLNEIDAGTVKPKALVICISEQTLDPTAISAVYRASSPDLFISVGLMEVIKTKMMVGED